MNSTMSLREKAVFSVLLVAVLYAAAVVLWFAMQESAWKRAANEYSRLVKQYADEESLIREKRKWDDWYEEKKAQMPMFDEEAVDIDTTWLETVEDLARKNHISVKTDMGDENKVDDIFEREITVKNFEGSLESLVRFMYDLENSEKGMFDMNQINSLKPIRNKPGYLSGSFKITCAYMKRDDSSGGNEK